MRWSIVLDVVHDINWLTELEFEIKGEIGKLMPLIIRNKGIDIRDPCFLLDPVESDVESFKGLDHIKASLCFHRIRIDKQQHRQENNSSKA